MPPYRSGGWSERAITDTLGMMRRAYERLGEDGKDAYYVSIPGMFHVNFTDVPAFSPLLQRLGVTGPIGAERGFEIVNAYSLAFFRHHLNGRDAPLLTDPSARYPEVDFGHRSS